MKFIRSLFAKYKTILWVVGCIIIGLVVFNFFTKDKNKNEIFVLTTDNLAFSGITIGGNVIAQDEVELSFQNSGRISQVAKQAGDKVFQGETIARLDTGTISANILKAEADLDAEIAKLNEYKAQEGSGLTEVETKKNQLIRELQNAYVVAEDAVKNKTDQYFEDPDSRLPELVFVFGDYQFKNQLNDQRYEIGKFLKTWQLWSSSINKENFDDQMVIDTKANISKIQKYLNDLSIAVNKFEENSTYSQTTIDKYKTDTSLARTNMNQALTDVITAQEGLRSTASQIPYQEARVKSARANIQSLEADLQKSIITSPLNGIVTKQDAKVGMSAFADQNLVTLISNSNYAIEAFIPEIYIPQIKIGTKAKVTLNPYGTNEFFDATVTYIDPVAFQKDGVASYKIELTFDMNDSRINVGMTADIELLTEQTQDSFWIPSEALIEQNGASYVKLQAGESVELRKIELGERTPEKTEVIQGLIVGDKIIIETKK